MCLTLLLHTLLVFRLHFPLTEAAKLVSGIVGVSDRTVREWRSLFVTNNGAFSDSDQGRYQRSGVVWQN